MPLANVRLMALIKVAILFPGYSYIPITYRSVVSNSVYGGQDTIKANYFSLKTLVQVADWARAHL